MPELPEVETVVRILNPIIKDQKIVKINIFREANIITGASEFKRIVIGKYFRNVERKGKYLIFNLSDGYSILSHLRMEGKYFESTENKRINQHDIFEYVFEDGRSLVYNDVRKFGEVGLYKTDRLFIDSSLSKLGPEPYEIDPDSLFNQIKNKNCTIKEAIMDQHIISGIGNIYADEILFAVSLNPRMKASKITLEKCKEIKVEGIRILNEAIEEGGSTIKSYHPKEGISGRMQNRLLVYSRGGLKCFNCGHKLRKIFVGGRGTVFCPKCQKEEGKPFVLGVTGPIHSGKSTVSAYYKDHGYKVFDADKIAKEIYLLPRIQLRVNKLFNQDVYIDGKPNSQLIRKLVTNNPSLKEELNKIIHPEVFKAAAKMIDSLTEKDNLVLDVPLLYTSGMDYFCDEILFIDSSIENRIDRLKKEGKDVNKLVAINARYPFAQSKKEATHVLINDGNVADLYKQLDDIEF